MSIEIKNLTSGYGPIRVLHNVSARMQGDGILGILGRNGMGKTTLMRCLAGLLPASSGQIWLGDRDLTRLKPYERARAGMSSVPQDGGIFPKLTVRENLRLGRLAKRKGRDRLEEVLAYFPQLEERLDQGSGTLSGGEQRMVSIGRALMTNPKVILLDEPSDGVMPILVKQIAAELAEINKKEGITMIIVEQNVPMILAMTTHCAILEKGRIVVEGTSAKPLTKEAIENRLAL